MALTLVSSSTLSPVTGENYLTTLAPGTPPSAFVIVFDFQMLTGCTVAVACAMLLPGASTIAQVYRSPDFAVNPGVADGLVTPPIPVNLSADLYVHLLSGTTTASTFMYWMIFELT